MIDLFWLPFFPRPGLLIKLKGDSSLEVGCETLSFALATGLVLVANDLTPSLSL